MVGDGRVQIKDIVGPHLVDKMTATKMKYLSPKWLF